MKIEVQCPICGHQAHIPADYRGLTVRCRRCQEKFALAWTPASPDVRGPAKEVHAAVPLAETVLPGPDTPPLPPAVCYGAMPECFGHYRIVKKLGRGGMSTVYLAEDTQLDRLVALKIPDFSQHSDPERMERFQREARAAATLEHPNLCPIHEVGVLGDVPYLVMAYVEGKPLSEFLRRNRPLPPVKVATLVRKLALALQEAHQRGVVHRDLKPSNIMINQRKQPIIMDFGLARRNRKVDVRLTRSGTVLGTPAYMAPEQVCGDIHSMGPGCDIYSLGVILYEMLTGRLPFEGPLMEMLHQVLTQEPPPPSAYRPDLDPELEAICRKAMAKKLADRYPSMSAMAAALTAYLRRTRQRNRKSLPPVLRREMAAPEAGHPPAVLAPHPGQCSSGNTWWPERITPWYWIITAGTALFFLCLLLWRRGS